MFWFNDRKIKIEYPHGTMEIWLVEFFPAPATKVKKLLGTVDMDEANREEIIAEIKTFLHEGSSEAKKLAKLCANHHVDYRTKAKELNYTIEKAKLSGMNRKKSCKDEYEKLKKEYKAAADAAAYQLKEFNKLMKTKEKFEKNLEIVEGWGK